MSSRPRLLIVDQQGRVYDGDQLQHIGVGTFIPDGPPRTECGLYVEELEPGRSLVLHSNSHLPLSWRKP